MKSSEDKSNNMDMRMKSKNEPDQSDDALNASKAFEEILKQVGDKNTYQLKLMFVCGMIGIFTGFHNIAAVYLAATPAYSCNVPYLRENNLTQNQEYVNISVPWVTNKQGVLEPSKCHYYNYDFSQVEDPSSISRNDSIYESLDKVECTEWIYDNSIYKSTIVTEWDLVCGNKWLMSTAQSSYMLGILTGAVVFSALSDKFGRRIISLISMVMFIVSAIGVTFSNSLALFLVLRFIVAGAGHGMYLVNYVLLMETVGQKGRSIVGPLFHLFFASGFLTLNLFAYLLRDWRTLQLGTSVPTVLLCCCFWLLPQSSRWLLMQGREEEGVEILKKIAKVNDKEFPQEEKLRSLLDVIKEEIKHMPKLSTLQKIKSTFTIIVDLVRTPNMRRRSMILFFSWFVVSMLFYGLIFSGATINASLYVHVTIVAFFDTPAILTHFGLLFLFGRRIIACGCYILGGLACVAVVFVPTAMVGLNITLTTLGKSCMTIAFGLVYILSAELVPTSVRNISLGTSSMFARIGSAIAPFVVDLLGDLHYSTPFIIFGVLAMIAGLLMLLLPETKNKRLPESIEEIESMPR